MPTDVVMPQMGESIFEGTITKWLKKAGDAVEKDEPLFEISTDKVDAEIPSPVAGVLTAINFPEGATVVVDTVVAIISDAASAETPSATSAEKLHLEGGEGFSPRILPAESARALASEIEPPASPPAAHAVAAQNDSGKPPRSSPLVRRMAKDNNLDLRQIAGTGSEGRITKEDVCAT
jgi:pyruvate dehydrogenase E2 component (dihydrolipoamide acetyltransferase)